MSAARASADAAPESSLPAWAQWSDRPSHGPTVGIEEEVMLLDPDTLALVPRIDDVLAAAPADLAASLSAETNGAAVEIKTGVHATAVAGTAELAALRARLRATVTAMGLTVGTAGTHPSAVWQESVVSAGARYQSIQRSMRVLAAREPTFALHVHVAVDDAEAAVRTADNLRADLPLLLALSANSPFWQGRDTGLASARTSIFGMFPRVGIPRRFGSYAAYVEAVDVLIRAGAFPEPTFVWWDVRPQPRFGTVEVRIMDAQTDVADTAALVALVQCLAVRAGRDHTQRGGGAGDAPEVLEENRFLAARDGMEARFVDAVRATRVPARDVLARALDDCAPIADDLDCASGLADCDRLADAVGATRQRELAGRPPDLVAVAAHLTDAFAPEPDPAAVLGSGRLRVV